MANQKTRNIIVTGAILLLASACGGGGGGGSSPAAAPTPSGPPTVSLTSSSLKGYTTENSSITWSSSNATSCTASDSWSGTKATSGNENYSFSSQGTYTFTVSCSGSGGSASDSVTIEVFDYKKVVDVVQDNYEWEAYTNALIIDWYTPGNINGVYSETWLRSSAVAGWGNTYPLETSVTEPNDTSLTVAYSGTDSSDRPINLNLAFNAWNQNVLDLYEVGESEPSYALITVSFSDLNVSAFTTYPQTQIDEGIVYATGGQILAETLDGLKTYLLPTIYGSETQTADLPTGSRTMTGDSIYYFHEADYDSSNTYNVNIAASGTASLNFNFDEGSLSGELVIDEYMDLVEFLSGNGPNALYTSVPTVTMTVSGSISGDAFGGELTANDTVNDIVLTGYLEGRLYGPDGKEMAASITFFDNNDNTDDLTLGAGLVIGQ
jgi:hypothetical protein